MRDDDLKVFEAVTIKHFENAINRHTTDRIKVNKWSEFSWSVSRHHTFVACLRRYYLNYYGTRRVREANDRIVSGLWWLKQITSLPAWIGTVIHEMAAEAMKACAAREEIDHDEWIRYAIECYRGGIAASKRGTRFFPVLPRLGKSGQGQWITFFEHVYPSPAFAQDIAEGEERLIRLMNNLFDGEACRMICAQPDSIREIDQPFQSFELSGIPELGRVKVFAIPDVLLLDEDKIQIIDWKTGDVEKTSIQQQAGVYLLYAHHQYKIPGEAITVRIANLDGAGELVEPYGGTPSPDEAHAFVLGSIQTMIERMDDIGYNTAAIDDYPMTDDLEQCRQCGFRMACWRT